MAEPDRQRYQGALREGLRAAGIILTPLGMGHRTLLMTDAIRRTLAQGHTRERFRQGRAQYGFYPYNRRQSPPQFDPALQL
jgi:hypothetical protein